MPSKIICFLNLLNPIFVAVIIFLILAGEHLVLQMYKFEPEDSTVSFTSDRHKIILNRNEIVYIESNDSEVWVYATEERRFRNKTGITQWEHMLGDNFIRVHRSYIVRKESIQETLHDSLILADGTSIPVSRKYRETVAHKEATVSLYFLETGIEVPSARINESCKVSWMDSFLTI